MNILLQFYLKHNALGRKRYYLKQLSKTPKYKLEHNPNQDGVHFKHSGLIGDLIYSIPAMLSIAKGEKIFLHLKIDQKAVYKKSMKHFNGNKMLTKATVDFLKPLFLAQSQFEVCDILESQQIDYDLDILRKLPFILNTKNIARLNLVTFGVTANLSNPWLSVLPNNDFKSDIVIARSFRYRTPGIDYSFLQNEAHLSFVGLPEEYEDMKKVLPTLKYCPVKNALEMAQIIAGCKFFIGNQSFPFALAEALKVPRALEVYFEIPDVVVIGDNAYDFYMQPQFEKIVEQLMRKTNCNYSANT